LTVREIRTRVSLLCSILSLSVSFPESLPVSAGGDLKGFLEIGEYMKTLGINSVVKVDETKATVTDITHTNVELTTEEKNPKTMSFTFEAVNVMLDKGSMTVLEA
tara:strand:- start:44 stop:358 length:315 start_codon:yes stop_codon:yes gene_type:complete